MRVRLTRLVGAAQTAKLVIGTFHAICAKYGNSIGLATNFSICDADESKKTINAILQKRTPELEVSSITLKEPVVRALISKAKATGQSPQEMLRAASSISTQDKLQAAIAHIYEEYDATLRAANALDFDDLLVMGHRLLKTTPRAIANLRHVVVDEFQDTNTMQYELMRVLAKACGGCVSVVGDPDQSSHIRLALRRYGAFVFIRRLFTYLHVIARRDKPWPNAKSIYLEENYRSTGSIVSTSLAIVSQDKQRPKKSLFTSHANGPKPLLREFSNAAEEAGFIAREIRRIIASSGGMVGFGDCAVLLRFNALSRAIEAALQQESVPSRVLGGHKFFERAEVKDVLVYLQLADNPSFTPAFTRVVNVPKRGVGEKNANKPVSGKSITEIVARATADKTSALNVIERICDGTAPDIKPPVKRKIAELVRLIRQLRKWAAEGVHAADLIRRTVDGIGYEAYLQRTQPDWEARWENVQELINFAAGVGGLEDPEGRDESEGDEAWDGGGYPSDDESAYPVVTQGSSSTVDKTRASDKVEPKKRPSHSTANMKQGTLSNWRSDSLPKPSPPIQPAFPAVEDILDLTGSDDEIPTFAPNGASAPTKKAPRQRASQQTPLRMFLQASLLSTDTETKEDDGAGKVTITTCHAAKGLEWPVVIVPAGETRKTTLSEFASCVVEQDTALFQRKLPQITKDELELFGKLLTRPVPTNERVQKSLKEL
ncbi:hypothetical protein FRC10_008353 [Ceratobasidium sp. 414]|nr:hypothetical protein FRC10_008353 [Ceratobasidium sp. 414]